MRKGKLTAMENEFKKVAVSQSKNDIILAKIFSSFWEMYDGLYHTKHAEQIQKLVESLERLSYLNCLNPSVATRFHPISFLGYGLCSPFIRPRPIMLTEAIFKSSFSDFTEILVHESAHSLLDATDQPLDEADTFDELIINAWAWGFALKMDGPFK